MTPAEPFLQALAGYGLPGVIIAVLLVWVWRKDKALEEQHAARVADAKAFTDKAVALNDKLHQMLDLVQAQAGRRRGDRQ